MPKPATAIAVGRRLRRVLYELDFDGVPGGQLLEVSTNRAGYCGVEVRSDSRNVSLWDVCAVIYAEVTADTLRAITPSVNGMQLPSDAIDYLQHRAGTRWNLPIDAPALGWATQQQWEIACRLADDDRDLGVRRTWFGEQAQHLETARLLAPGEAPSPTVTPKVDAL